MVYGKRVHYAPSEMSLGDYRRYGREYEWLDDDDDAEIETLDPLSVRSGGRLDDYGNEMPWVEPKGE